MILQIKPNKKFLSISVLTHVFLLMIFILSFPDRRTTLDAQPEQEQQIISSQLIHTAPTPASSHQAKQAAAKPTRQTAAEPTTTTTNTTPALLALLHAAIQREQQYPASAQEQTQEGRVTISFTLHPNGTITNLYIQHTSGTKALDQAALTAVNTATPFQQVDRYLKNPENYQVDLVFKLT